MNNTLHVSHRTPEDAGMMAWVKRHPLVTFFVLAYALTWGPTLLFSDFRFIVPGPLLAALTVTASTTGWAGLRKLGSRMMRWRVGWRWYVAALGIPLAVDAVATALNVALGAPVPVLAKLPLWTDILLLFPLLLINPQNGPMAEEPGWRGYALPGLQGTGRSPFLATLLLALLVAGWHVPFIFVEHLFPLLGILGACAATFWYAWLFNRTRGSVFLPLIMHTADGLGAILIRSDLSAGADLTRWLSLHVALTCLVAIGLVAFDWQAWQGDAAPKTVMAE